MRIAKSYKHYKHIDARNARVLMNECNQSAAGAVVYYYEAYTMKLSKLDYSFESIDLIDISIATQSIVKEGVEAPLKAIMSNAGRSFDWFTSCKTETYIPERKHKRNN